MLVFFLRREENILDKLDAVVAVEMEQQQDMNFDSFHQFRYSRKFEVFNELSNFKNFLTACNVVESSLRALSRLKFDGLDCFEFNSG